MHKLDVIGTEIMDKEIGSTSDENSASVKHKEVYIIL